MSRIPVLHPEKTTGTALAYRPDVDGLRAVAVLAVILYHAGVPGFGGGYVGVDVFFVISGFLITGLLTNRAANPNALGDFYVRRLRRIFPALAATVALTLAAAALLFDPRLFVETAKSALASLFAAANVFFYAHAGYFDVSAKAQPLLHVWSLSLEEQFYFLWPLFMIGLRARPRLRLWLTPALLLASLALSQYLLAKYATAAFFLLPGRMFLLLLGAGLSFADRRPPGKARTGAGNELLLIGGLAVIAYAVYRWDESTPFPGVHALYVGLGAAAVIAGGQARYAGWLLRNRAAVAVGLVSYSAYLVHWPLVVFTRYVLQRGFTLGESFALTAASLAGAALLYRLVETPLRTPANPAAWRPFARACAAAALAVSAVAAHAWASDGWLWRMQEPARTYYAGFAPQARERIEVPLGAAARTDFVLVGDSHAWHFIPAFDALARELGLGGVALTPSACPVLDGALTQRRGQVRAHCVKRRNHAFAVIEKQNPAVIVFSHGYDGYQGAFSDEGGNPLAFATPAAYAQYWVDRFEATFTRLRRPGRRFVILGPGLRPGFDLAQCLSRPSYFDGRSVTERCKLAPRAALAEGAAALDAAFAALDAKYADVMVIDPKASLCDAERCRGWDAARIFFTDEHHLSPAGAAYVVAQQHAAFVTALTERAGDGAYRR
jgi:peptidoglycan/LPS O-acetylase OafA/YrhL